MSSRAGVRDKVRGEYRFSSLMKQKKKGKFYFIIYIAGFFFEKNFPLLSDCEAKKGMNGPVTTTNTCARLHTIPVNTWGHTHDLITNTKMRYGGREVRK